MLGLGPAGEAQVAPWPSAPPVWTLVNGMAFAGSNKEINRIGLAELVVSPWRHVAGKTPNL